LLEGGDVDEKGLSKPGSSFDPKPERPKRRRVVKRKKQPVDDLVEQLNREAQ